MQYAPQVFVQPTLEQAKTVILMPEAGLTTEQRWERETDWLMERIAFPRHDLVVDYGCGVGRLAQRLCGNPVLGVDISSSMRSDADVYVRRGDFGAVTPTMFSRLTRHGLRADGAIACWVLQHCLNPANDIELLAVSLKPAAPLYVVNMDGRAVPMTDGASLQWLPDDQNIYVLLCKYFTLVEDEPMPAELCQPGSMFSKWVRNE